MLRGLLEKAVRETWRVLVLTCAGLALAMGLFVQILPQFQDTLNELVLKVPFLRMLISGLMGIDVSQGLSPKMLLVIVWTHPIVLAIVWGFELVVGTRLVAEIEHGTIDVLLGWPVSRGAVFLAELLVWLASGLLLLSSGSLGLIVSARTLEPELRPDFWPTVLTLVNLLAVYVLVGGAVQCIAVSGERRGKAIGLALVFLLASFLLDFLSSLWPPAGRVVWASFLHYYEPAQVMLGGSLPLRDFGVLLGVGVGMWALAWLRWTRRSVLTT